MKTRLRFSDVVSLDLKSVISQKSFTVIQKKTKNKIRQPFIIFSENLVQKFLSIDEWPRFCNYNLLKTDLTRLRIQLLPAGAKDFNSLTHIFRHLDSSFLLSRGYSKKFLSDLLGHVATESINSYIHKDL
jgi:site-specific recombinase XerD